MQILVATPHGMCSGVARALRIAAKALEDAPGETLWCYHKLVHNEHVVNDLRARGARFVDDLAEIPEGARVLFSAHGVSPAVRAQAAARNLRVIDATCPFVAKVHAEARAYAARGLPIALVGHKGHDEILGVLGEAPDRIRVVETPQDAQTLRDDFPEAREVALLSQTTVSQAMVEARLADLRAVGLEPLLPDRRDICTATQERQDAVRDLAAQADRILVLGSVTSSNSKRLVEVAENAGCPATLIAHPDDLDAHDLSGVRTLGLTSGASTPEPLLHALLSRLGAPPPPSA